MFGVSLFSHGGKVRCTFLALVAAMGMTQAAVSQPLPFPVQVESALGFFDPTVNVGFNAALSQQQLQIGGGVAASVANLSSQAALSTSNRRSLDPLGMEDIEDNLGALYTEPAWTLGKGNTSVGLGYAWYHYTQFDGVDLDDLFDASIRVPDIPGVDPIIAVNEDTNFSLDAHVWTLSYGKGITDTLDFFLILPMIKLEGSGNIAGSASGVGGGLDGPFSDGYDHNDWGIGDTTLRLKKAVCQDENYVFSLGGDLVVPTGEEEDFLGGGDFGYRVRALYSRKCGNFYPTVEVGYYWTTLDGSIQPVPGFGIPELDESDFDQFEYRVSFPYSFSEKMTLSAEWVGSISEAFTQNDVGFSGRFDMGHIKEGLVFDAGVRIPVDDDGLRTDATPFVAMEYRF